MKGILSYQLVDPQLPNSEEGWFIENENGAYKVSDLSIKKIVSGRYAVSEGSYSMPFLAANQFEDFIESLETDLPIEISIGNHQWCELECAKSLGFNSVEEMRDPENVKQYRRNKNDEYAREQGYKDWDDLVANSKFGGKAQNNEQTK